MSEHIARCKEEDIGLQIVLFCRKYLNLKPPEDLELSAQVDWCWQHWQEGNTLIVFNVLTSVKLRKYRQRDNCLTLNGLAVQAAIRKHSKNGVNL